MNRIILCGVLAISLLTLTGCGNSDVKTLVCTQNVSGINIELTTKFAGKKVDNMKMKYAINLSSYNETQIDAIKEQDFCTLVKGSMIGYENAFNNCKQNVNDKELLITADFDVNKIEDDNIKEESTPEEAKKGLEQEGYTCTIK